MPSGLGRVGPTVQGNPGKMYKSSVLATLPLWNGKDPDLDQTVGSRSN